MRFSCRRRVCFRRGRQPNRKYDMFLCLMLVSCVLLGLWCVPPNREESAVLGKGNASPKTQAVLMTLSRAATGALEPIALEDYVCGVVAGEVPVEFDEEALKAQAVIARTFALTRILNPSDGNHGDLCDDYRHCQAYCDESAMRKNWGEDYEQNRKRIAAAVAATVGEILTYQGEVARTYYHSTCGGRTASAAEVWGEEIPYLQSVACKWDSDAPRYEATVEVSLAELPYLLGDGTSPCIALPEGATADVVPEVVSLSPSGRIAAVDYGGVTFKGTDFRSALGLNSACFDFSADGSTLKIHTLGYGHGVGLCQHGANGMAEEGADYRKILSYYYPGTKIGDLSKYVLTE